MRIGRHDVAISNPDNVFFPLQGLTKGDLVDYYVGVAELALPHLRRRPLHMQRARGPQGEASRSRRVELLRMTATVVDVVHEIPAPDNATVRTTFPNPETLTDAQIHAALEEIDRVALFSTLSPAAEKFISLCTTELAQRAHRAKVSSSLFRRASAPKLGGAFFS